MQVVGFKHHNFSKLISKALELERIESEGAVKKSVEEKEEIEKAIGQTTESGSGKRKQFEGLSSRKSSRGRSSRQKPPQSDQQTQ